MMTGVRRCAAAAALALALGGAPASRAAQQGVPPPPPPPEPEMKQQPPAQTEDQVNLGAELVNVPFNVTDKKGHPITDLRKEDVQVLEDDKAQEIFSFERQLESPLTIALLIDTSGSQEATIGIEREASSRFFQKVLRPDRDLGSVVTFSKDVTLEQDLTNSLGSLDQALSRARVTPSSAFGRGGTAPTNPMAGGTSLYDAVYLASNDVLRREAGRRVIILVTDGVDTTSSYDKAAAIERATRSEVIVYCIAIGDPDYGVSRGTLDSISKETGGRTFEPRRMEDLDKAFDEIQNDLRQQYIVSYAPSNLQHDGAFRRIEVRGLGDTRKDLKFRYRRGYYAPTK
jgi:VWFA-related protein